MAGELWPLPVVEKDMVDVAGSDGVQVRGRADEQHGSL